jgi:hypothetical protein
VFGIQLLLIRLKQPRVNWEASWPAHLVRLAAVRIDPSRYQNCVRQIRSPHALDSDMAVWTQKSKKIMLQRNNALKYPGGNRSLTIFLQSFSHHISLEEKSDD